MEKNRKNESNYFLKLFEIDSGNGKLLQTARENNLLTKTCIWRDVKLKNETS